MLVRTILSPSLMHSLYLLFDTDKVPTNLHEVFVVLRNFEKILSFFDLRELSTLR